MDPLYPNTNLNLGDPDDYSASLLFSNSTENFVTQSPQSSQNVGKESQANKWDATEDITLMSAWCFVSETKIRGKNQKKEALWSQLNYDTTHFRPECEVGNEESGGSTKRSRITEEGDYCVNSNREIPTSGGSIIKHPTGRYSTKKKGKKVKIIMNLQKNFVQ
ncbi:hypothetical protein R6Q57_022916 [Mikania cordata]